MYLCIYICKFPPAVICLFSVYTLSRLCFLSCLLPLKKKPYMDSLFECGHLEYYNMASDSSIQEDLKFTSYKKNFGSSTGIALGLNTGYYSWSKNDVKQLLSWVAENMPESFKRLNKANINAITDGAFPNHPRIKCSNVKNKLSNLKRRYLVLKLKLKKVNISNDTVEAEKIQKAIARDLPFFDIIDSLMLIPNSPENELNCAETGIESHRLSLSPSTDYILDSTESSTGGISPNFEDSILESPDPQQYPTNVPTSSQTAFKQRMRAARRQSPYNLPISLPFSRRNSETVLGHIQQQTNYNNRTSISSGTNNSTTASSTNMKIMSPLSMTPSNPYDYMLHLTSSGTTAGKAKTINSNKNDNDRHNTYNINKSNNTNKEINKDTNNNKNNNSNNTNSENSAKIDNNNSSNIDENCSENIFSLPSSAITAAVGDDNFNLLDQQNSSHGFTGLTTNIIDQNLSHSVSDQGLTIADGTNTNWIPASSIEVSKSENHTNYQSGRTFKSVKQIYSSLQNKQMLLETLTKYKMEKRLEIEEFKAKEELALKRYEIGECLKMERKLNDMKAEILAKQLEKAKAELEKVNIDSELAAVELEKKRLDLEKLKREQNQL